MTAEGLAIVVRTFEADDQAAVRAVILQGLGEHFGFIDDTLNPDLNDIAASYAGGVFLVACDGPTVVGSGALTPRDDGVAIVSRMSTAASHRRRGVGRAVLSRLVEEARARDCSRLVLGTNADWADAIAFYVAFGFAEMRRTPTGVVFELAV